jgi:hypothetical protein
MLLPDKDSNCCFSNYIQWQPAININHITYQSKPEGFHEYDLSFHLYEAHGYGVHLRSKELRPSLFYTETSDAPEIPLIANASNWFTQVSGCTLVTVVRNALPTGVKNVTVLDKCLAELRTQTIMNSIPSHE